MAVHRPTLHVLDTGTIHCGDMSLFRPDLAPGVAGTMPVRSYVVTHPDGVVVWDTGLPDAYAELADGYRMGDVFRFRVEVTMREQLLRIGVDPRTVDVLALSHLHLDHTGNLALFPNATVLLQEAERAAAYGSDPEAHQYDPATYADLRLDHLRTVDGDHDVFGDGTVVLKSWPGHSPGHQGLSVTLDETGVVVLGADIAHTTTNFGRELVSQLNSDQEQSIASIRDARAYLAETAGTLWLNHDLEQQAGIRTAPARYS